MTGKKTGNSRIQILLCLLLVLFATISSPLTCTMDAYADDTEETTGYLCLADNSIAKVQFRTDNNWPYEGSLPQGKCTDFYTGLSTADKSRIVGVKTIEDASHTYEYYGYAPGYANSIGAFNGCNIDGTLSGENASKDKVFILSAKEYEDNKTKVIIDNDCWLRSHLNVAPKQGDYWDVAILVNGYGVMASSVNTSSNVQPAAYLDTSLFDHKNSDGQWVLDGTGTQSTVSVKAGDKVYFAGKVWTVLNNKKIKPDGTESSSSGSGKYEREAPSAPSVTVSGTEVTITDATAEMEYLVVTKGTTEYDWTDPITLADGKTSITVEGLQPLTEYTVAARYAENEDYYASPVSTVDVTTGKAPQSAPTGDITFTVTDTSITVNPPVSGQAYILVAKDDAVSESDWSDAKSGSDVTFTGLSPATTYDIYTRKIETDTLQPSPAVKYQAVTGKSAQTAPTGLGTRKASSTTDNKGAITDLNTQKKYQYSEDKTNWTDIPANSAEIALPPGTYYVRFAEDATHDPSPESYALIITAKGTQNRPSDLIVTNSTDATSHDGSITGVTEDMEYSLDEGSSWTAQSSGKTVLSGLAPGTVLVRMSETADLEASEAKEYTIGDQSAIDKAKAKADLQAKITEAENKLNDGTVYTYPTKKALEDEISAAKALLKDDSATTEQLNSEIGALDTDIAGLVAKTAQDPPDEPGDISVTSVSVTIDPTIAGVQYILVAKGETVSAGDWADADKTKTSHDGEAVTFRNLQPYTEYDIYARKAETADKLASEAVKVTVRTNRAGADKPTGLTASKASSETAKDGKITGLDSTKEYQYSADGGNTWTDISGSKEITGLGKGEVKVRFKAGEGQDEGKADTLTIGVKEDQERPEGLTPTDASNSTSLDGSISGATVDMEYSVDGGETWKDVTGSTISGLGAGDVKVRMKGTADLNPSEAVTVTIGNADQKAADRVKEMIDALPAPEDVRTTDRESIEAARRAYDALTEDQKALIDGTTLKHLTDDETALEAAELAKAKDDAKAELQQHRDSKNNADYDADGIKALDDAKTAGDRAIDAADSLEEVSTALEEAKKAIDAVKTGGGSGGGGGGAVTDPVQKVVDEINALPGDIELTDKAAADQAKKDYDALTDEQRRDSRFTADVMKKLNDSLDTLAAKEVEALIKALPDPITESDEDTVKKVQEAYDALNDAQKAKVDKAAAEKLTEAIKNARKYQMGEDGTALGRGASWEAAEKAILGMTSDADPAGSKIMPLKAKSIKQTKKSIKVQYSKPSGAVKYVIYGNKCGKKNRMKRLKTTTKAKLSFKKIAGKKVKKGTSYKFIVVALDKDNNVVSTSKVVHAVTKGTKKGNPVKLTVKSPKSLKKTLTVGKSFTINSKVGKKKGTKIYLHVAKSYKGLRYESSNPAVAKVSKSGKVTAVSAGTAKIIVYAQNGASRTVKVTVA